MAPPETAPDGCWPLDGPAALCHAIDHGHLDGDLTQIIDAINRRNAARARHRADTALARLALHHRVQLDNRVKPQYLRGQTGTIHELHHDYVVVLLDHPVGRFTDRHIRTAPELLIPIPET
jgi:hypothetical protein